MLYRFTAHIRREAQQEKQPGAQRAQHRIAALDDPPETKERKEQRQQRRGGRHTRAHAANASHHGKERRKAGGIQARGDKQIAAFAERTA